MPVITKEESSCSKLADEAGQPQPQPQQREPQPQQPATATKTIAGGDGGDQAPSVKASVGRYAVGETIGTGSFARVCKGVNVSTGEEVALKVVDKRHLIATKMMGQFKREVAILSVVSHPHCLTLKAVVESRTKFIVVTEFVAGGDVLQCIERQERLPEPQARRYLAHLVSAVRHCHRMGIAHRDIKPENLLITARNTIKLSDFGFACYPKSGQTIQAHCGTPQYMAPEVLNNTVKNHFAADIWALGITYYTMLAGCLPWDELDPRTLINRIACSELYFPTWFSKEAAEFLRWILNPDPATRPKISAIKRHPYVAAMMRKNKAAKAAKAAAAAAAATTATAAAATTQSGVPATATGEAPANASNAAASRLAVGVSAQPPVQGAVLGTPRMEVPHSAADAAGDRQHPSIGSTDSSQPAESPSPRPGADLHAEAAGAVLDAPATFPGRAVPASPSQSRRTFHASHDSGEDALSICSDVQEVDTSNEDVQVVDTPQEAELHLTAEPDVEAVVAPSTATRSPPIAMPGRLADGGSVRGRSHSMSDSQHHAGVATAATAATASAGSPPPASSSYQGKRSWMGMSSRSAMAGMPSAAPTLPPRTMSARLASGSASGLAAVSAASSTAASPLRGLGRSLTGVWTMSPHSAARQFLSLQSPRMARQASMPAPASDGAAPASPPEGTGGPTSPSSVEAAGAGAGAGAGSPGAEPRRSRASSSEESDIDATLVSESEDVLPSASHLARCLSSSSMNMPSPMGRVAHVGMSLGEVLDNIVDDEDAIDDDDDDDDDDDEDEDDDDSEELTGDDLMAGAGSGSGVGYGYGFGGAELAAARPGSGGTSLGAAPSSSVGNGNGIDSLLLPRRRAPAQKRHRLPRSSSLTSQGMLRLMQPIFHCDFVSEAGVGATARQVRTVLADLQPTSIGQQAVEHGDCQLLLRFASGLVIRMSLSGNAADSGVAGLAEAVAGLGKADDDETDAKGGGVSDEDEGDGKGGGVSDEDEGDEAAAVDVATKEKGAGTEAGEAGEQLAASPKRGARQKLRAEEAQRQKKQKSKDRCFVHFDLETGPQDQYLSVCRFIRKQLISYRDGRSISNSSSIRSHKSRKPKATAKDAAGSHHHHHRSHSHNHVKTRHRHISPAPARRVHSDDKALVSPGSPMQQVS